MVDKAESELLHKARVLVVDDEKRIRDGCHRMLTQEGFDVAVAETGDIGLKMIEKEHFDIILLDLMMPGMPGMEVLPYVKSHHPDTVVVVITGYATLEHAIEAMKNGAFDFISKPFSPQDLREVVDKAIKYIRTLQDIATEKSRMRVLINHLADGVMATDAQKNVALANPAFLKMIGFKGKEAIGLSLTEVVQNERLNEIIDQALAMPSDQFTEIIEEFEHGELGDDKEAVLAARCIPFRDRLNRTLGTVTVLHDITALKKMDQLKSDFVSMVAHELKSPMNSVMALIKVLRDGLAGKLNEKQQDILGRISERVKALSELSADLLDLAKIESGLITQEKEKLELGEILEAMVDFHRAKARDKGIELVLAPMPQLPPVLGNRHNIEEVISNLVSNAIKYTCQGGRVEISSGVEGRYARISVKDTGIGISKKDQARIFDRFYRVKDDNTRSIPGTGLGLSIVKSILEAHNGMITVESEPGQGSTFHVYIPIINS